MTNHRLPVLTLVALSLCIPRTSSAQEAPNGARAELLGHFNYSSGRLLALAEAVPAEKFAWRPGEGVKSIEEVYTHIARYNYYYPQESLGIAAPDGVNVDELEAVTGKAAVLTALQRSVQHVRDAVESMPEARLSEEVTLYGRSVAGWSVLLQLVAHMNEHLGQSIAYARMNGVVPPWSGSQ